MMAKNELALQQQKQKEAIDEMTPALRAVYKKIKSKTASMEKGVVMAMYDVGEMVKEATANERKYGEEAVPQLAVALGKRWSAVQLWEYRAVATTFTRKQIESMLEQKTRGGNTITMTHLKKLAGVADPAKRKKYREQVFQQDLTTDELASAIRGPKVKTSNAGRLPSPPKTIDKGLHDIVSSCESIAKRVKIWDEHVFDKIVKGDASECNQHRLEQLEEVKASQEAVVDNANHLIDSIDKAINRVKKVMDSREENGSTNGHAKKKPKKKAAAKKKAPAKKAATKAGKKKKTTKRKAPVSAKDRIAAARARKASRPAAS